MMAYVYSESTTTTSTTKPAEAFEVKSAIVDRNDVGATTRLLDFRLGSCNESCSR